MEEHATPSNEPDGAPAGGDIAGDTAAAIARVAAGDEQALAAAFSRHRQRLWQMVSFRMDRRLHGRVDPDDILQESFLDAAKRIEHFNGDNDESLYLWLRLIVQQTMIDIHRRHIGAAKRNAAREVRMNRPAFPQATSKSLSQQLVGSITSPSRAVQRAELITQMEHAIGKMDEIDREVLALRHFEEMSNKEVAMTLGIEEKAASIRYVRALRRLKAILAELSDFGSAARHG
ncbi:MAG: sigma-70 family RNA polymerase sigma factor [Phycisphaera sp.]|nr:sigma-70 family RNA polymerase sigma factor [Phycisphaera sp.]